MKLHIFSLSTLLLIGFSSSAMDQIESKETKEKTEITKEWKPFTTLKTHPVPAKKLSACTLLRRSLQGKGPVMYVNANPKYGYKPIQSLEIIPDTSKPLHFMITARSIGKSSNQKPYISWLLFPSDDSSYNVSFFPEEGSYCELDSVEWVGGQEEVSATCPNGVFRATIKNKKENGCLQVAQNYEVQVDYDPTEYHLLSLPKLVSAPSKQ
jgi:hypothetical protein